MRFLHPLPKHLMSVRPFVRPSVRFLPHLNFFWGISYENSRFYAKKADYRISLLPKPSLRWILHIMDQWLYSISDHCIDNLTNYRQNCYSSIVEAYRILTDEKQNGHLVHLDAKAAFDKVMHSHLFRRMYHAGIWL
jgi:hypothetical protein